MNYRKKILAIIGSTRANSSNLRLVKKIEEMSAGLFEITFFEKLDSLPHFNPDLDNDTPPLPIMEFRKMINDSDGLIICTPEYIFSIPGSLKNAIEWCVSTIIFSHKPVGLITASASGEMGHEELKLIMKTLYTKFSDETTLLIKGIKGKFSSDGILTDTETIEKLQKFVAALDELVRV